MKRACSLLLALFLLIPGLAGAADLAAGSSGAEVQALQQRLKTLGLLSGSADGIYGQQTTAAVTEAQRLLSLAGYEINETGIADTQTQKYLFDEACEEALRTMRRGSRGTRVKALQTRLIDLKLLSGTADGAYGANTENAVRLFQEKMQALGYTGLAADGVATPSVVDLLNSDLSVYGFQAPVYFDDSQPQSLTADTLYSKASIVIDAPSGQVLFENHADDILYPASTTKIMTLLLAIEHGDIERQITVPESAADIPQDSSRMPVYPGETMTMQDLLYGLMLRSGNDAANAVAELCAGSVQDFVSEMNAKAQSLGMKNTHFMNPHGYHDPEHYTTARDLAALTREGLTNAAFCQIATCRSYTLPPTQKRDSLTLTSTYEIFDPQSAFYIDGAAGVKSGYTSHAGFCFVGAYQKNDRTLIAVVLGAPSRNRAWTDLKRLFAYGVSTF